jgi:catechol 2,3-dioxygenase-like lactoylglutathione lyase family enzyme
MKRKRFQALTALAACCLPLLAFGQHQKEKLPPVLFEHLRLNVADKAATAAWYVENVGLEIVPAENKEVVYVADKDHNFMFEFSSIPGLNTNYANFHIDAFHVAFEGHKTIEAVAERMLKNGATQLGEIYRNKVGDYVLNLKDINGLNSQLIHRVDPFYPKPAKSTIRFEHFAFNTPNQMQSALWFVEFMDLPIPWSKDIDKTNNMFRNYRVPYVGDSAQRMSFELFGKAEVDCSLYNLPHDVIHIAFNTDEPEKLAKRMIFGGARQVGDKRTEANGDVVIDLYDPRGAPLRLIQRKKPIL